MASSNPFSIVRILT